MNKKKLENGLIEHCAPTLAGMKSASLFSYFHEGEAIVKKELEEVNGLLNVRGYMWKRCCGEKSQF